MSNLQKELHGKCATCTRYTFNDYVEKKGCKCTDKHDRFMPLDSCNSGFFGGGYNENRYVSDKEILDMLAKFKDDTAVASILKKYESPVCFITTAIVDILKLSDDCEILKTLRNFREKFLKVSDEYKSILANYDIVGPKIATALKEDEYNEEVSMDLYMNYLCPCVNALTIEEPNYLAAINIYTKMVEYLIFKYSVSYDVQEVADYQMQCSSDYMGHGKHERKRRYEI